MCSSDLHSWLQLQPTKAIAVARVIKILFILLLFRILIKKCNDFRNSPYLAPVPYRGKRNESAYIVKVVEKLSDIYELPESEIVRLTDMNAIKIFNI